MAYEVDSRVVSMNYNGDDFLKGIIESDSKFEQFKATISDSDSITKALDKIADKFSMLNVVGTTAVAKLTTNLMSATKGLYDKTLGQILTGGKSRALNIEQAKFQFRGLGMDVEASMASALEAVKGTAYGLDAAAKAAAQFGASGMTAGEDMTRALKGIAGVAAMSNSSFEDISRIFTTASSNGKIMTMQLRQLSSRGLNASAALAKSLGKTEEQINDMVSKGQVSFKMFSDAMSDTFGEHAKAANKTFEGSMSNMKAALSRIGANFFTPFLENAKNVFNVITPLIDKFNDSLKPAFTMWERFSRVKFEDEEGLKVMVGDLQNAGVTSEYALESARRGVAGLTKETNGSYNAIQKLYTELAQTGKIDLTPKFSAEGIKALKDLARIDPDFKNWENMPFDDLKKQLDKVIEGGMPFEYIVPASEEVRTTIQALVKDLGRDEDDVANMLQNGQISFEQFTKALDSVYGGLTDVERMYSEIAQTGKFVYTPKISEQGVINLQKLAEVHPSFKGWEKMPFDELYKQLESLPDFTDYFDYFEMAPDGIRDAVSKLSDALGKSEGEIEQMLAQGKISIEEFAKALDMEPDLKFGGATMELAGFGKVLAGVGNILNAVKPFIEALIGSFKEVFGIISDNDITSLADGFLEFTKNIKPSEESIKRFGNAMKLVFSIGKVVLDWIIAIGKGAWQLISALKPLGMLIMDVFSGLGGSTNIVAANTKAIDVFSNAIEWLAGKLLKVTTWIREMAHTLWNILAPVLKPVWEMVKAFFSFLADILGGSKKKFDNFGDAAASAFKSMGERLQKVQADFARWGETIKEWAAKIRVWLDPIIKKIQEFADSFKQKVDTQGLFGALKSLPLGKIAAGILGIWAAIKVGKGVTGIFKTIKGVKAGIDGFFKLLKDPPKKLTIFDKLKESLVPLQKLLKASAILAIAAAILMLVVALTKLAALDPKAMLIGLGGLAGVFGILIGALKGIEVVTKNVKPSKLMGIAVVMIAMGVAVNILANAVVKLSALSWKELGIGLTGVAGSMAAFAGAIMLLSLVKPTKLLSISVVLLAMGTAVAIVTKSIISFSELGWKEIGKGLLTFAGALAGFVGAIMLLSLVKPTKLLGISAVLLSMALAIKIVTNSILEFSKLNWKQMGVGLITFVAALGAFIGGIMLLSLVKPTKLIGISVALIAMGIAVKTVTNSILSFSNLSWKQMGVGLITFVAALAAFVGGIMLLSLIKPTKLVGISLVLLTMGIAIKTVTASILAFSELNWKQMGVGLLTFVGALAAFVGGIMLLSLIKPTKLAGISLVLLTMAIAIKTVTGSILSFSALNWKQMGVGLITFVAALGALVGGIMLLSLIKPTKLAGISAVLLTMAIAIKMVTGSILSFSALGWKEMGVGLIIFVAALGALVGGIMLLSLVKPEKLASISLVLLTMAVAIKTVTGSILAFSAMSWQEMGVGLITFSAALGVLVGGIMLLSLVKPEKLLGISVTMIAMALAIKILTNSILAFSGMSWGEMAVGLVAFGAAMLIMVGSLALLSLIGPSKLIATAGAMVIVAGAVAIMALSIKILAGIPWKQLLAAGLILVGMLAALAGAALLMTPALPLMLALAAALALFGAGLLLISTSIYVAVAALAKFNEMGDEGGAAITRMIDAIIQNMPKMIVAFVGGLTLLVVALSKAAPMMIKAFLDMLGKLLEELGKFIPKLVEFGMKLIVGILRGIAENIQDVVEAGADIIVNFINGLAAKVGDLIDAGVNLLLSLLQGISDAIKKYGDKFLEIANDFAKNLAEFIVSAILNLKDFGKNVWEGVKSAIMKHKNKGAEIGGEMAGAVVAGSEDGFEIKSPSKVYQRMGDNIVNALDNHILKGLPKLYKSGEQMGENTTDGTADSLGIHSESDTYAGFGDNIVGALIHHTGLGEMGLFNAGRGMGDAVANGTDTAVNAASGRMARSGASLTDAFTGGVTGAVDKEGDRIGGSFFGLGQGAFDNFVNGFDSSGSKMQQFMQRYGFITRAGAEITEQMNTEMKREQAAKTRDSVLKEAKIYDDALKKLIDARKAAAAPGADQAAKDAAAAAETSMRNAIQRWEIAETVETQLLKELVAGMEGVVPGVEGVSMEESAKLAYQFSEKLETALSEQEQKIKDALEGTFIGALTGMGGPESIDLSWLGIKFSAEFMQGFVDGTKGSVAAVGDVIANGLERVSGKWIDVGVNAADQMFQKISEVFGMEDYNPFNAAGVKMGAETAKGFGKGLAKGTRAIFNWIDKITNKVKDQLRQAVEDAISKLADITVNFASMGLDAGADWINWLLDGAKDEAPSVGNFLGQLVGGTSGFVDMFASLGGSMASAIIPALASALGVPFLGPLLAPMANIGASMAGGLGNALISALAKITPSLYDFLSRSIFRILPESWQNWITDTKEKIMKFIRSIFGDGAEDEAAAKAGNAELKWIRNHGEQLGVIYIDALEAAAGDITGERENLTKGIEDWIGKISDSMRAFGPVGSFFADILDRISNAIHSIGVWFQNLFGWFTNPLAKIGDFFSNIGSYFSSFLNTITFGLIGKKRDVEGAGSLLGNAFSGGFLAGLFGSGGNAGGKSWFRRLLEGIWNFIVAVFHFLTFGIFKKKPQAVQAGVSMAQGVEEGFLGFDVQPFEIWPGNIFSRISEAFRKLWDGFWGIGRNIWNSIFGGANEDSWNGGTSIIGNIFGGMSNAVSSLWNNMKELGKSIGNAILNGIKSFLGIKSPSTEGYDVMVWLFRGMGNSVLDNADIVLDKIDSFVEMMLDSIQEALETDTTFTVKPELDLSGVNVDKEVLSGLMGRGTRSVRLANVAANSRVTLDEINPPTAPQTTNVTFEQNNYSPKALSVVDVYRNTNSQISKLRTKVGMTPAS